ncbi:MAG: J domain-containing protein [Apibacter sp.]|uniref:DnaJ domain-containing protein n=1 Tax=Apibacter mensalis TaxID=1586267 RepID=A0A0X3ARF8_9FLAO|nr:DnaJ domain-containing protein [Apibacter mensalis]MCO6564430.1 J domain-containing protein [Apibacter sp.]CVK16645.1 DnaJ domain-containing protein [Apibacter mensalis]
MKDFYNILGVSSSASFDEIKKSYRKLALQYHPDRNSGNKRYEEIFINISEAYHTLSNEESRKNYDLIYKKKLSTFSQPVTPYLFLKKFQDIRKFIYKKGKNKISKNALYKGLEKLLSDENIKYLLLKSNKQILELIIIENLKCIKFLQSSDKEKIIHRLLILANNDNFLTTLIGVNSKHTETKYNFTTIFYKFTNKIKHYLINKTNL